jgi:hypothetical protein
MLPLCGGNRQGSLGIETYNLRQSAQKDVTTVTTSKLSIYVATVRKVIFLGRIQRTRRPLMPCSSSVPLPRRPREVLGTNRHGS